MRKAIAAISLVIATGANQCFGADQLASLQLKALGLDSTKTIEWNLTALKAQDTDVGGVWSAKVDGFIVSLVGQRASLPERIILSISPGISRSKIETVLNLTPTDARESFCTPDELQDDGIGCGAILYGCSSSTAKCAVRVRLYSREKSPDYSEFSWTDAIWSSEGFDIPIR